MMNWWCHISLIDDNLMFNGVLDPLCLDWWKEVDVFCNFIRGDLFKLRMVSE